MSSEFENLFTFRGLDLGIYQKGFDLMSTENVNAVVGANEGERLTRKQKRELGILPVQILANAKEADLNNKMTAKELAFAYAAYVTLQKEYGASWNGIRQGTYGVDWNSIIDALERIMELLLKFLPLFI